MIFDCAAGCGCRLHRRGHSASDSVWWLSVIPSPRGAAWRCSTGAAGWGHSSGRPPGNTGRLTCSNPHHHRHEVSQGQKEPHHPHRGQRHLGCRRVNSGGTQEPSWYRNLIAHPDVLVRDSADLLNLRAREPIRRRAATLVAGSRAFLAALSGISTRRRPGDSARPREADRVLSAAIADIGRRVGPGFARFSQPW